MELKKVQQQWNSFPELSMEERPILSSDLEKIVVANPLTDAFYLKNKLLVRIYIAAVLWLLNVYQLRVQWKTDGDDLYQQAALFFLLCYFIYFHVRLLLFADYPSLLALPLVPFLGRLETVLDKYILSFKVVSVIAGFYLLALVEQGLSWLNSGAFDSISRNGFYKWLIIIFLSVSFYILLLQSVIPKYRKLLAAVTKYKYGITTRSQKK
ncbi:MAG TPA: hypothetical protein VK518_07225 [Puia sp.]|nr:hypothetical protein [Puia sp.]